MNQTYAALSYTYAINVCRSSAHKKNRQKISAFVIHDSIQENNFFLIAANLKLTIDGSYLLPLKIM